MSLLSKFQRRSNKSLDPRAEPASYNELCDVIATQSDAIQHLQEEVERLTRIAEAADHFVATLSTTDEKGAYIASFTIEGDSDFANIVREASWRLSSALTGAPAPVPVNIKATIQ